MSSHKFCPGCEESLPMERFAANRKQADGKQGYCRSCKSLHLRGGRGKMETDPYEQGYEIGVRATMEDIFGPIRRLLRERHADPNLILAMEELIIKKQRELLTAA